MVAATSRCHRSPACSTLHGDAMGTSNFPRSRGSVADQILHSLGVFSTGRLDGEFIGDSLSTQLEYSQKSAHLTAEIPATGRCRRKRLMEEPGTVPVMVFPGCARTGAQKQHALYLIFRPSFPAVKGFVLRRDYGRGTGSTTKGNCKRSEDADCSRAAST
jgi:hypothetical protein